MLLVLLLEMVCFYATQFYFYGATNKFTARSIASAIKKYRGYFRHHRGIGRHTAERITRAYVIEVSRESDTCRPP